MRCSLSAEGGAGVATAGACVVSAVVKPEAGGAGD